jgi:hypothetical protein
MFPDEYMTQMSATIRTGDLGTATIRIQSPLHSTWDRIVECRPSASRVEFHLRGIEWRIALTTEKYSDFSSIFIFSGMWGLCSFPEDDTGFFGCEGIIARHSYYCLVMDCFGVLFLRYLANSIETVNNIAEYTSVIGSIRIPESVKFSIPCTDDPAMMNTRAPGMIPMSVASANGNQGRRRNPER